MKPIKIKIKGINSYISEQEIDFEKLAQTNIFGIFGETGSGKTTILDSIILALYGVSDRDSLQNIINVSSKDAYVEFTFEMENANGGVNKYFVRRDFHLRNSGLKTEAYLNDLKTKSTIAEMPDNVNNKLLEIIGIGKKEFTKCIALPQGEFDRFLSDTPALRKKTLAKLFDLEQFGILLNEKLKNRKHLVALKKATLEEKAAIYSGISEETIRDTEKVLENSDVEVKKLEKQIARDKKLVEKIKDELNAKQELLDMEVSLSIKQSELSEINLNSKQIEYTEKYGEFTQLNNKYNNCIDEIKSLTDTLDTSKEILRSSDEELNKLIILLNNNKIKIEQVEKDFQYAQVSEEKKKLHEEKIASLQVDKQGISDKLIAISSKLTEATVTLNSYKKNLVDMQSKYKALESQVFDNMDAIDKLNNCKSFKDKEDFARFLMLTKNKINPESLSEVENFNIYDEVTTAIHDMENYELGVRKEISQIYTELKELKVDGDSLEDMRESLIENNDKINAQCDDLEEQIVKVKENIAKTKSSIDTYNTQITELNEDLQGVKKEINGELETLKKFDDAKDYDFLEKLLATNKEEQDKLQNDISDLVEKKQKSIINIEVSTTNLENYKEKMEQLKVQLKPFSKAMFKTVTDNSLIVGIEELPALKEKVENFHKELELMEKNTENLREKTKDYVYTKDDHYSLLSAITNNETKLGDLRVFINVNKITIDIQKKNLVILKEIKGELDEITKQYNAIEKLESLLSGGALIDFVAEEYMGLITDFANTYVYQISKGKYLLNYDGDFNVIDNFNGGIKRGVKTLSGGERFIVSLSLALGISQSIAINNNKNFNFFFIDEGFGNLSENYIEKVLQSFDALIKLNFTVGFITHVEKMQYYLSNRIIVTKDNNDEGSKIEQFF